MKRKLSFAYFLTLSKLTLIPIAVDVLDYSVDELAIVEYALLSTPLGVKYAPTMRKPAGDLSYVLCSCSILHCSVVRFAKLEEPFENIAVAIYKLALAVRLVTKTLAGIYRPILIRNLEVLSHR